MVWHTCLVGEVEEEEEGGTGEGDGEGRRVDDIEASPPVTAFLERGMMEGGRDGGRSSPA